MLNMNSPTVQNLMQSGFNPYTNSGYIPQQQPVYNYGYNPYMAQYQQPIQQQDGLDNWEISYDPMPKVVMNEARGINSQIVQPSSNNYYGNYYNNQAFMGYMNPILMRNQIENERIRQREEAIQQGRIWRTLLKGRASDDENFDIDAVVQKVESLYYYEPPKQEMSIKEKIVIDKNNHIAELESRLLHYKQNNIPIVNSVDIMRANMANYYNRINEIIGDVDNCDMVDYFTRVYPELKYEQLSREVDRYNKNRKNRYNSNEFNKLLDKETQGRPDSYYAKIMETFSESGTRFETPNGLVVTADEMEVKLPERLLRNSQDVYYEQRRKFFNAIFNKEGNGNG